MNRAPRVLIAVLVTGLLLAVGSAQAAVITTSPLTNNESDIVNLGTSVVSAANLGSGAGGNTTVDINGIIHPLASAGNNGPGADLIPELNINSSFDGNYRSGQIGAAGYTGDMLNLLGGIAGNGAPGPISLEINGLTPGQNYLFQGYWEANNFGQTVSVTFEGTDTQTGITGVGGLATLISYSFTATDTALNADLSKTAGSDNNWWLGYSLQVAPGGPSLLVTNGGFETPDIGGNAQVQDIPNWFDTNGNFTAWYQGEDRIINDLPTYENSQHAAFNSSGYIYQSLGQKEAGDEALEWSFTQGTFSDGNASTGFEIAFYEGDGIFTGADGTDIASAGLTLIDSATFNSMNNEGILSRINEGVLSLAGVADGTEIWLRIGATGADATPPAGGAGFAPIDNVTVNVVAAAVPEPATAGLALLGFAALSWRRRRQ